MTVLQYTTDDVWVHFGDGRQTWAVTCEPCQIAAVRERRLHPHALACWKLEIWYGCWEHSDAISQLLMDWASETPGLAAKLSRTAVPVVASDPRQSPYPAEGWSRVALVYYRTKDELQRGIGECRARLEAGGAGRGLIHWRRGCWVYDDLFGSWTSWPESPAKDL
ncbi:MAG: hypothetical protein AB1445_00700 [Bacillota bacterium]